MRPDCQGGLIDPATDNTLSVGAPRRVPRLPNQPKLRADRRNGLLRRTNTAIMHTRARDEALWPARGIAEHAYCPRLFYYLAVEGVFVPSHDTEEGAGVHRKVDRPSPAVEALDEEDPAKPRRVRSLVLTSARLGVTAALDLAEIAPESGGSGGVRTAVPVEYRKGRPRRVFAAEAVGPSGPRDEMLEAAPPPPPPCEPWPTDRVQVGLQALLLEEAGYSVPYAVVYYASERTRLVVAVDAALRAEALATLEAAKTAAASGVRPPPLLNDPRCPRCSLQPVCLPDEVNHQRFAAVTVEGHAQRREGAKADGADVEAPATLPLRHSATPPLQASPPRRMWPPRDDGIHLVLQKQGVKVGVRGESLRVTDREGQLVRDTPLAGLESLALVGSVQVSTQALCVLADREVPIAYLSAAGRLVAMMDPLGPVSAGVRAAQMSVLAVPDRAISLAKAVIVAKIANQRTLLMRNAMGLPEGVPDELARACEGAERASSIDEARGHEGNAAAVYFEHFARMFKGDAATVATRFDANGRQRRPPPDPINAVLSFAYSMLSNECVAAARLASLEPTIGALHTTRPGRPALALDLMEPFRPLIADSVAVSAFNRGELVTGHFAETAAGCAMTDAGRKAFFGAYGRRMETEVSHPAFEYRLCYRRMLYLHARLVAAWMLGEVPTLAFLTTR